ncbi:glycosyltransferase family 4 protein [Pseudomonas sp. EA_35y_Pfl2_R5]|uniref:glycosyltransferase family 4 protein n=1 Tax=Pseudomonas sp. EA_35y_Pfl2_R5 TaxID=3088690 RepID=UPI0030D8359B
MRILWVLPYLPWPTTSGGKTRQYHLLRSLAARGHRITLLVQSKSSLDTPIQTALEPFLERLIVLPRRSLRHPVTLLSALFGPWPLLTVVNGLSAPLQARFSQLLEETWDVIQIEHSYSFQPFDRLLRGQSFVLTEHNLESSLGAATYDRFPGWLTFFVRFDQWRARRWENQVFDHASRVIAVTEDDAVAMRQLTQTPVDVVVNGVDTREFAAVQRDAASQRILFVGNYEYAPNKDAVQWALDEILPLLWRRCPQARFAIAGYALPQDWAELWPDSRIEWVGFVPQLTELQARSAVFFAPLRHGGGSKLKVLEALAAGLPLVSTAQGVSGLPLVDKQEYCAGETPEELAAALAQLLEDPHYARQLAVKGRDYVRDHHDWQIAAAQLEHVYQQLPVKDSSACV